MITPTWEHYGTHDDSAYPELWEGCIRAWAPCLGPSGDRLFDLGTGKGYAPFVLLSPASAWGVNCGSFGLSIPYTTGASTQYVQVASVGEAAITGGLAGCTLLITASLFSSPAEDYVPIFFEPTPGGGYTRTGMFQRTDSSLLFGCRDTEAGTLYGASAASPPIGAVITIAGVWDANQDFSGIYVNGTLAGSNVAAKGQIISGTCPTNSAIGGYTSSVIGAQRSAAVWIYDVRVYNMVLCPQTIMLYDTVRAGVYSPRRPRRFYSFADVSNRRRRFFLGAAA